MGGYDRYVCVTCVCVCVSDPSERGCAVWVLLSRVDRDRRAERCGTEYCHKYHGNLVKLYQWYSPASDTCTCRTQRVDTRKTFLLVKWTAHALSGEPKLIERAVEHGKRWHCPLLAHNREQRSAGAPRRGRSNQCIRAGEKVEVGVEAGQHACAIDEPSGVALFDKVSGCCLSAMASTSRLADAAPVRAARSTHVENLKLRRRHSRLEFTHCLRRVSGHQ